MMNTRVMSCLCQFFSILAFLKHVQPLLKVMFQISVIVIVKRKDFGMKQT